MADYIGKPVGQLLGTGLGYLLKKNQQDQSRDELQNLYSTGVKRLGELISPTPIRNTGIAEDGTLNPPQQIAPDFDKGIQSLYQTQGELLNYGDEGKPYAGLMQSMFDDQVKLNQPPKKDIREGNDGLWYDLSSGKPELIGGEKKKEKTVYNQKFYEGLTPETLKDLTPNQIKDGFFFMPKELQDALYQSNPELRDYVDNVNNQGAYEKTTGSRRTGRRLGKNKKNNTDLPTDFDTDNPDDGEVSPDLWADVKNAENKITEKYNKFNNEQKKGLQNERVRIANELKQFDAEFASGQYTRDEMIDALNEYIAELEKANVDEDILDEAFAFIKKRAMELGVAF